MKYEIEKVHISSIKHGDTVMHEGHMRTVSRHHLRHGGFMGTTLFGDSYRLGTKPVEKVHIIRAMPAQ